MNQVGIEKNGIFIGAMKFPDRKKPSLVIERGNEALVIGSFIDEKRVGYFEEALHEMLQVGGSKDER